MLIYVVRHANAGDPDPEQWPDDTKRPLTKDGIRRFARAARGIRALDLDVDVLLASPSVRTWETANILHEEAKWPEPVQCIPLQGAPSEVVISVLSDYREREAIAIVGHQPHLSELVGTLLRSDGDLAVEFKKGTIACIRIIDPERPLSGNAELRWLLPPRMLRAIARGED